MIKKDIFDFEAGEIININKPAGYTSFQVVKKVRKKIQLKKVGHAGTLDPFATGILLILTGKATKQSAFLSHLDKEYLAEIEFGVRTDSNDIDGKIIARCDVSESRDHIEIEKVLRLFEGEFEQIPPIYSAIKYKGKPLYKYARRQIDVEVKPRLERIENICLKEMNWPQIKVNVTCSKGTYIRSLARDIGESIGTGAYLKSLVRTRIGDYTIQNAYDLDEFLQIGV